VLIVGSGDLGRMVADCILDHGELGFRLVGSSMTSQGR
jgi:hypothetical protein